MNEWVDDHKVLLIFLLMLGCAAVFVFLKSEKIAALIAGPAVGLLLPNDKTRKLKKEVIQREEIVNAIEKDRQELKKKYYATKKKHTKEVQDAKEDYSGLTDDRLIAMARERGLLQPPDGE